MIRMIRTWETEPAFEEWITKSGLTACIKRHEIAGHLCGYVSVPKSNLLFKKSYYDCLQSPICNDKKDSGYCEHSMSNLLRVHGGISYAHEKRPAKIGYAENDEWCLGFDCGHGGDFSPFIHFSASIGTYKDFEYVKQICESLAAQISELEKG